jgi:hypothetical protein
MKTQIITLMLSMAIPLVVSAESFRAEQIEQRQRIRQGVRSGELTRPEASRLLRGHVALNREYARDRRDGGGLTFAERWKLDKQQDRLSRSIFRQKHDRQDR